MPQDSFTEVTRESWVSRIGNAFKGILAGLLLFIVAFPLLFWNEGRSVKRYKVLKKGADIVVSVSSDSVDAANEGKLVHLTGKADTGEMLSDDVFGVSANALKLKRAVEMYQWKETSSGETRKKLGGGTERVTTYKYSKAWSARAIDSADFKEPTGHQNPGALPLEPTVRTAGVVTLGAFTLAPSLVGKIDAFEALPVGGGTNLPAGLEGKARIHNGGFYIGADPTDPRIGDARIAFSVVQPMQVSVIARQTGTALEPYPEEGGTIELLEEGVHSAEEMFAGAQEENRLLTWLLRLAGFLLMLVGINLVLKPLSVIADVLPILGTIVSGGTGLISLLLSAIFSMITIAVAWIFYRPLLGIVLIAAAAGLAVLVRRRLNQRKAASPA